MRGRPQPLDLEFLCVGFFPEKLLATLKVPHTFSSLARSVRHYETHHGHLEVDEMNLKQNFFETIHECQRDWSRGLLY